MAGGAVAGGDVTGGEVAGGAVAAGVVTGGVVDGGTVIGAAGAGDCDDGAGDAGSAPLAVWDGALVGEADGDTTNHVPSTPWPLTSPGLESPEKRYKGSPLNVTWSAPPGRVIVPRSDALTPVLEAT